jgi:hypothetical protein
MTKIVLNSLDQERLERSLSPAYPAITSCHPGSPIMKFEGSLAESQAHHGTGKGYTEGGRCTYSTSFVQWAAPTVDWRDVARVTIDMLPDVALLELFDFYVHEAWEEEWQTLVHVCRKWRHVVLGSPRRLDLRLYCRTRTRVKEKLDVWPLLPIAIWSFDHQKWGVGNIVAALEHNDRVYDIEIWDVPSSQVAKVSAAMRQPFPMMTRLMLRFEYATEPAVPASFLGGSAPRLQELFLHHVAFKGLPKLLLSATHLVVLSLWGIPHSGYISPEAIVACLSVLTRLNQLEIGFESPRCRPDWKTRRPPPQIRTVLPVLTKWRFKGVSEYLEDLLARIDAPLLNYFDIVFFHQLIFDTPQLTQFISRTPNFQPHNEAFVGFSTHDVSILLLWTCGGWLALRVSSRQSDWQLSSLAQFCNSFVSRDLILAVERLYIRNGPSRPQWQDDIENSQWLELLRPFAAVKDLYISEGFTASIAPALQELVGESVTEVIPTLENLFFEETPLPGPVQEAIGQFVAARRLASRPIAVSSWERGKHNSNELVEIGD